jgi:hypothetical protein
VVRPRRGTSSSNVLKPSHPATVAR